MRKELTKSLRYGSRKSDKLVRCYRKDKLGAYRVELELHGRLLRRNGILAIDDFIDLPDIVSPKHLSFVDCDWDHLERYLVTHLGAEAQKVITETRRRAASLRRLRRYLRMNRVSNVHRFFIPLALNNEVKHALERWARHFERQHGTR